MKKKGFSLFEILLLIVIFGVLATTITFLVKPAEKLKYARDTQRIADLEVLKTAIQLFLSEGNTDIGGNKNGKCCISVVGGVSCDSENICNSTCCEDNGYKCGFNCTKNPFAIDGEGWLPINFTILPGGPPLSKLPIDPNQKEGFKYCYVANGLKFELNAQIESDYYKNKDPIIKKDGGNNESIYEVGTKLDIIECCQDNDCLYKGQGWTCSQKGVCLSP